MVLGKGQDIQKKKKKKKEIILLSYTAHPKLTQNGPKTNRRTEIIKLKENIGKRSSTLISTMVS